MPGNDKKYEAHRFTIREFLGILFGPTTGSCPQWVATERFAHKYGNPSWQPEVGPSPNGPLENSGLSGKYIQTPKFRTYIIIIYIIIQNSLVD